MGFSAPSLKTEASHNKLEGSSKLNIIDNSEKTIYNFFNNYGKALFVILGIVIILTVVPPTIVLMANKNSNEKVCNCPFLHSTKDLKS